jgi:teichuronic acid biosynthesis glycosyltransferase TuaH
MRREAVPSESAGSTSKKILFLSHSNRFGAFRVGSHHLSAELARQGHDVYHVSTPVSAAHVVTKRVSPSSRAASRAGWTEQAVGLHDLVPATLAPAGVPGGNAMSRTLALLPYRRFDVIFLDQPLMWSPRLTALTDRLVYRPTDVYGSGRKKALQAEAVRASRGIVATSEEVLRRLNAPESTPVAVIPNGVDVRHFSTPSPDRADVAVYVGALDSRFDSDAIVTLAEAFPAWRFDVYGPGQADLVRHPANIFVRGSLEYARLPSVLAAARIGLLPLSSDDANAGRSPMKLYEYLASGLSVLSSSTPTIRQNDEACLLTYSSQDEMIRKFQVLTGGASPNITGREVARDHGWEAKSQALLRFAEEL